MKNLFFYFLHLVPVYCFSQNLLVNGGFEEENICTEYKINCAPEAWISSSSGFANYFKDANRAHRGEHCMAIEAGHERKPFQRTFIRSSLLCGLRKDHRYRLEFFIKSPHALLDSIGIRFTSSDPLVETKRLDRLEPSLFLADAPIDFLKDSSWQRIEIVYTANGSEAFIMIANFSRRDINGSTNIPMEDHFFVFLDDIALFPLDENEKLCADWQQTREDIYEQNERHEFLQRSIKYRRSRSPEPIHLTPNIIFKADTLLLPDVLFATGKKDLEPGSFAKLDSFCRSMQGRFIDSLIINGHADNTGSVQLNAALSQGRAQAVAGYVKQCGMLSRVPVRAYGYGSRAPIASNDTPAGRQQNRRVEVFVYFRE